MSVQKPQDLSIELLCQHPHHARTLARWHFDEWHHLYENWSLVAAYDDLMRQHGAAIPTTLLALHDGDVVGSVSLLQEDHLSGYEHLTPWLASLYVRSDWRGRGVGGELVVAAVEHARTLGITRLYLFTPAQREFYVDKGFRDFAHAVAAGAPVTVMVCDL
jgi:N-acetylglutamate synthase-like GNAT family acetyltransferase